MLVVELSFSEPSDERLAARPAHREFVARLHKEGKVVMAGPWADDTGALLVLDCDREEVDRILAEDAYYRTPGVEVTAIRAWTPVFGPERD
jgi:uncharacterized protein YciI